MEISGKEESGTGKPKGRRWKDAQQESAYAVCCQCGGEIYLGQPYYEMADGAVCIACLPDYAGCYFMCCLRTALPPEKSSHDVI